MQKIILSKTRKGSEGLIRPWIRIGDMAALRIMLCEWRTRTPDDRLIVVYDPQDERHEYSKHFPHEWAFSDVADELWIRDTKGEKIKIDVPELWNINNDVNGVQRRDVWEFWKTIRPNKPRFTPALDMPEERTIEAAAALKHYGVPAEYAVLQMLFDAGYDKYRNAPISWWRDLAMRIAAMHVPLVIVGPSRLMTNFTAPPGCFPLYKTVSDPFNSLALMAGAKLVIAGESGLIHWATFLRKPTIATYRHWAPRDERCDFRPVSWGAPMLPVELESSATKIAETVRVAYNAACAPAPRARAGTQPSSGS